MAEAIQKKLKSELEKYQEMQKDVSKSMSARHKLETQLTENNIVKEMWRLGEGLASIISGWLVGTSYCTGAYFRILYKKELDLLDSENTVYKLIGPVLVKQDLDEAKATVSKRLEYINGEIQRYETLLKEMERKLDQHREVLSSLQQEYQRAQGRPVGKV